MIRERRWGQKLERGMFCFFAKGRGGDSLYIYLGTIKERLKNKSKMLW